MIVSGIKSFVKKTLRPTAASPSKQPTLSVDEYWTNHHVSFPDSALKSADASLRHFVWRNRCYPGYLDLMPVGKANGLSVLDYGCGPANDLVGFGVFSKPKQLIGIDVSAAALDLARRRLALHDIEAILHHVSDTSASIPLPDQSVDVIHCSGVLHHTSNPKQLMLEFRRILKSSGFMQIMVYHRNSIWMHLYVSYLKMLFDPDYMNLSKREAFARSTDGFDCPIADSYSPSDMSDLASSVGLRCEFSGASMSLTELDLMSNLYRAIRDPRLDPESAEFLSVLTFNERNWPLWNGVPAGINACFRLMPA